jgi:hypothetical protein
MMLHYLESAIVRYCDTYNSLPKIYVRSLAESDLGMALLLALG